MHCKICHKNKISHDHSGLSYNYKAFEETSCTKACGEEGVNIDMSFNKTQKLDKLYPVTQEKELCQHQWFEIKKSQYIHYPSVYDCENCLKEREEYYKNAKERPRCMGSFKCKMFPEETCITIGCILCPEVRIKWEDGEIEVLPNQ